MFSPGLGWRGCGSAGDGHQCQALLQCKELAASVAPCCGNIRIGPQLVHGVPSTHGPGATAWQRKGHQDGTENAECCWPSNGGAKCCNTQINSLSGCTENAKAACSGAEQALQDCRELILLWQLSKERVLFQGIRNGVQTAPWVTRLKLVQPKRRGLIPDSHPAPDGSTCRLCLDVGAGWPITSWATAGTAWSPQPKNSHPQVGQVFGDESEARYHVSVGKSIYPLCACSPDTKAFCYKVMPIQCHSKVLKSCLPFFPLMSDFLLTWDCETSLDVLSYSPYIWVWVGACGVSKTFLLKRCKDWVISWLAHSIFNENGFAFSAAIVHHVCHISCGHIRIMD